MLPLPHQPRNLSQNLTTCCRLLAMTGRNSFPSAKNRIFKKVVYLCELMRGAEATQGARLVRMGPGTTQSLGSVPPSPPHFPGSQAAREPSPSLPPLLPPRHPWLLALVRRVLGCPRSADICRTEKGLCSRSDTRYRAGQFILPRSVGLWQGCIVRLYSATPFAEKEDGPSDSALSAE